MVNILCHSAGKFPQAVVLLHDQLHIYLFGIADEGVPAGLILLIGMDVGVKPVGNRLNALGAQLLHTGDGAGGAAGVQQSFGHVSSFFPD